MNAEQSAKRRRIFIVDDHPLVREWLTNLINQQPDLVVCGEAHEETHYAERALSASARGYIIKRETAKKVVEPIRQVLEGKLFFERASLRSRAGRAGGREKKGLNRSRQNTQ